MNNLCRRFLLGTRIEITVQKIEKLIEPQCLLCIYDILHIQGLESILRGTFDVYSITIEQLLEGFRGHLDAFRANLHGANTNEPNIQITSTLTFARQALGWSRRNMDQQLSRALTWKACEQRRILARQRPNSCMMDGRMILRTFKLR